MSEKEPNKDSVKKVTHIQKFNDSLNKHKQRILKLLDGEKIISYDEFVMAIMNVIKMDPKFVNPEECDQGTLFASIILAAELQLRISTKGNPEGLCYLILRKKTACLDTGYKGLVEIAYRSDKITSIIANPVYENEFYTENERTFQYIKYTGMDINVFQLVKAQEQFLRSCDMNEVDIKEYIEGYKARLKSGKGELRLVYASCMVEGRQEPIWKSITLDVLKQIENLSPSTKGDSPQYSAYRNGTDINNMMQVKAAIKLLFKFMPKQNLDKNLARAIQIDDEFMSGKKAVLGDGDEVNLIDDKEDKSKKYNDHFADLEDEPDTEPEDKKIDPPATTKKETKGK